MNKELGNLDEIKKMVSVDFSNIARIVVECFKKIDQTREE